MFSGGTGSWRSAEIDKRLNPDAQHRLIFTDVLYEDADTYRFLIDGAAHFFDKRLNWSVQPNEAPDYRVSEDTPIVEYRGNPEWRAWLADLRARAMDALPGLIWLVEGRDPWEVFRDKRFIANSQVDQCSRILKRETADHWRIGNCTRVGELFGSPDVCTVGIGFHERHRFDDGEGGGIRPRNLKDGWLYEAPLIDAEIVLNEGGQLPDGCLSLLLSPVELFGLRSPALYKLGYPHGNCGGMCVKAGMAQWRNRHRVQPDRFRYDRIMERKLIDYIGADISILKDRRGGETKPMTLEEFEQRIIAEPNRKYEYLPGETSCGCTGALA